MHPGIQYSLLAAAGLAAGYFLGRPPDAPTTPQPPPAPLATVGETKSPSQPTRSADPEASHAIDLAGENRDAFEAFCRENPARAVAIMSRVRVSDAWGRIAWAKARAAAIALEASIPNWADPVRDIIADNPSAYIDNLVENIAPQDAIEALSTLPQVTSVRHAIAAKLADWAETDYPSALAAARDLPDRTASNEAVAAVLPQAIKNNDPAALDAIAALHASKTRNDLSLKAVESLAGQGKPGEAVAWINANLAGSAAIRATAQLANSIYTTDPAAAAELTATIPGHNGKNVRNILLSRWGRDDPEALLAWAGAGGDPETIKIAHSYALEAALKADPSSLPEILAKIDEPDLRKDTVADAIRFTHIKRSPPQQITAWVANLPANLQPGAALDILRSVRHDSPDDANTLLTNWQSDPALARPLAEFIVQDHIRREDFTGLNRFLLQQHTNDSPLYPIARDAIDLKNFAPQYRTTITKDLPDFPPLNIEN